MKKRLNESVQNKSFNNREAVEKTNLNINLPNFIGRKVKNLKRSINIEKTNEKINDIQINTIN